MDKRKCIVSTITLKYAERTYIMRSWRKWRIQFLFMRKMIVLVDRLNKLYNKIQVGIVFLYWRDGYWPMDASTVDSVFSVNDLIGQHPSTEMLTSSRNPLFDTTNTLNTSTTRAPCKCM